MITLNKIYFVVLLLFYSGAIVRAQSIDIEAGIQLCEAKNLQETKEFFLKLSSQDARSFFYLGMFSVNYLLQRKKFLSNVRWRTLTVPLTDTSGMVIPHKPKKNNVGTIFE